ncbi:hypothetical protein MPL3356_420025 [Mesorhizobium plurifarium]|uniref:Uncharacterized protein n=1 Tax=Mesorhizobium plurifarium TaxID=69974 RepID=A0A090G1B0_MESPL|nr:hypothetical protein MPL3356_420025 [Mesorhizobium plurifarium]
MLGAQLTAGGGVQYNKSAGPKFRSRTRDPPPPSTIGIGEGRKHPSSHAGERRARDVELSYDARAQVQAACC